MPQMNKGEKYIFGKSLIQDDLTIYLSSQAVEEYHAGVEGRAYLFTASESAGGFCVTRRGLLEPSKLGHILAENPALRDYQIPEGEFIQFKERSYCWVAITIDGVIQLKSTFNRLVVRAAGCDRLRACDLELSVCTSSHSSR